MKDELFTEDEAQAKMGQQIRTKSAFSGVPTGTTGRVIGSDLGLLCIQWNLPERTRPLLDWFSKREYVEHLEEIGGST